MSMDAGKKNFSKKGERASALNELIDEGWEKYIEYKDPKWIGVQKTKPVDEIFEDKVWNVMYGMGFTSMSRGRNFVMSYDFQHPEATQQIDVFAADEETVLIIECKSAEALKSVSQKKPIEAFIGQTQGLRKEAQQRFPGSKVKFIWATQNINLMKTDERLLKDNHIAYFNEKAISYYGELTKHLGKCARYQLLGNLFASADIKNMDNKIPAIQGKMGNNTYYSFSIEPEKLLKIGYVLHRNEANRNMMPTYQRLIKKKRLLEISGFINQGGCFPNSLIVSIDTKGHGLQFDPSSTKVEGALSKIGVLHLPKRYRSAYIIDGQHRLYGYANSKHKDTDNIPVIAFVDLEQSEQVQMFMDINEKPKY